MQAAFQEHCDSAIPRRPTSRTPRRVEDVRAIYELAYELKCKGVTVYRDGSRDNQVLSTGATEKAKAERDEPAATAGETREIGELQGHDRRAGRGDRAAEEGSCIDVGGGEPAAPRRSARVPTSCAARRSARRRRSARCSCTSPRTSRASRSRCSSRSARPAARRWRTPRRWGG